MEGKNGVAAWGITAFISADGGSPIQVQLPSTTGVVTAPFEIPYASSIAFWFEGQDDTGCTQWDSNGLRGELHVLGGVTAGPAVRPFFKDGSRTT